ETATRNAIALRFSNPLALELFAEVPKYKDARAGQGFAMSASEIRALPRSVSDQYRSIWQALPERTRVSLHLAALSTPHGQSRTVGFSRAWDDAFFATALVKALGRAEAEEALRSLKNLHTWI